MNLREADRLQNGDILVTPTTAPPWTPLFGIAAAVVTDVGGALSHCGIVAREYGIPCVGGTGNGTPAIKDGQLIEVDGSAGIVKIISDG
jgi:pyruvate,water dikinase